ncbi:MAG: hypothetical protein OXE52_09585 [Chloroflexi bacterium]|nr:hypothetical protein [Chloroflexota bacterium]
MKTMMVTLIGLFFCIMPTLAQEDSFIAYGETVQGEITVGEYEQLYGFKGTAGDLIRLALVPNLEYDAYNWSNWRQPEILLLDRTMNVIVSLHAHESAVLIHELAETGIYHVIATGWGGRSEDNVGEFELSLERIPFLVDGEVADCEASNQLGKHYAVKTDSDFQITYEHIEGAFRPEVSVNVIADDPYSCGIDTPNCSSDANGSNLHDVAVLSGSWLDSGVLEVKAQSAANGLFIVQVAKNRWDYRHENESATCAITLNLSDS